MGKKRKKVLVKRGVGFNNDESIEVLPPTAQVAPLCNGRSSISSHTDQKYERESREVCYPVMLKKSQYGPILLASICETLDPKIERVWNNADPKNNCTPANGWL